MSVSEPCLFPLVEMQAVLNVHNEWVALTVRWTPATGDANAFESLFGYADMFAALAPLDVIILLADPLLLDDRQLDLLPAARIIFDVAASALADEAALERCKQLSHHGYRFLVDGMAAPGVALPSGLRAVSADCSAAVAPVTLLAAHGPHHARGVDSAERHRACREAGFAWFSGDFALHPEAGATPDDGTSRKRLLALLGMLARDAESRELEELLKQDPALSYHLLKLVNSAAFALSHPITSFGQAISLLGRRQLQRWLQLLLYARQQDDGLPNPLLPQAALRAAQMEMLCKLQGGDRDLQDMAFMTGVFSLLDVLFAMPMDDIVAALSLDPQVAGALVARRGRLGALLKLTESPTLDPVALRRAETDTESWWRSLLQAYHWAIQVSRNL